MFNANSERDSSKPTAVADYFRLDILHPQSKRDDTLVRAKPPVLYTPIFSPTCFLFQGRLFLIKRQEGVDQSEQGKGIVIMCLFGRTVVPIKNFLDVCRDASSEKSRGTTRIWGSNRRSWDTSIFKQIRPLDTVHLDEKTKTDLVADIEKYLNPEQRQLYIKKGWPFRRGYLLHGPPGTGKTSVSVALAGKFHLDVYMIHLPSIL